VLPERRQVVEVVIQRAVIEYRIVGGTCTCGRVQRSAFPEGVTATVQYGPGVSALAMYLTQSQLLPYQGTAELFQELAGIALSPGHPPARRHRRRPSTRGRVRLKQKVSGCFRSETKVEAFAMIRSYLSTLRKQSANLFQSFVLTFQRSPPMPRMG